MQEFGVYYIHCANGSYYIGSSYGWARFSRKKKPSLFFTLSSARQMLNKVSRERYEDDDISTTRYEDDMVARPGVEIRSAQIVLE